MKLKNYLLVCTLLVLSAAGPFLRAQGNHQEAIVTGITGTWKLAGNKLCTQPDNKGDPILHFACSFVVDRKTGALGTGTGASLVILINGKNTSYHCDSAREHPQCHRDSKDSQTCVCHIDTSGQSTGGFWAAIVPLFAESVARYITPVSRGLEAEVADSVVPLQGDRVDLAPVFQEMDPGTYRLHLESLSGSAGATAPLQLQWSAVDPQPFLPPAYSRDYTAWSGWPRTASRQGRMPGCS